MAQTQVKTSNSVRASNAVTGIAATGNTDLLEIDVTGIDQLAFEIVVATQALDAFIVQVKVHPDSTYQTLKSAITSTPSGIVVDASGTLATTAAAASAWAVLNTRGFTFLKFLASAAVDGAAVTIRASGGASGSHQ